MTHTPSAGCCWRRRARAPAMSSRMERGPECSTHSWMALPKGSPSAASPRYAISFHTWNEAPSGPTLPHLRMRRSAAAVAEAARLAPALPLLAGGKSFGGRMTSQAQAASPLPGVRGLAFLGFPLHPAGRPSDARAEHLFGVEVPILFLQGSRDKLADLELLQRLIARLGERASLRLMQDADHSFRVPARAGRRDADVQKEILDTLAAWILSVIARCG